MVMAEFSYTLWLSLVFFAYRGIDSSQDIPVKKSLNLTVFDCKLDIEGTKWNMECVSQEFPIQSSSKFFVSELHGNFDLVSPLFYETILNSTTVSESELYLCGSQWRYFIKIDPNILFNHCDNYSRYIKQLTRVLIGSSLKNLKISRTKTPYLILNILSECFNVKNVILSHNKIPMLSSLPVHSNNTITMLSLKENSIQIISDGLFRSLHSLTSLDLSHNLLKSITVTLFEGISGISELDMSYNLIEYISNDAFIELMSLKSIYLKHNNLKHIGNGTFRFNSLLSIIDISHNNFGYLPADLFQNMSNLRNITCTNCSLTHLDKDMFLNSPVIELVVLDENRLQVLHEGMFKTLQILEAVHFGINNISYLAENMFSNHPYLLYVNLTHNEITNLTNGVFSGAPNIRILDLSKNKISTPLTDDYIKNYTDLEYFGLHHNLIEAVEIGISTEVLIRKLDISHNLITKFNVGWKQLVYMERLNAGSNLLTSIDLPPCIPGNVKQTSTFLFFNNKISKISIDALLLDEERVKVDKTMTGCFFNGLAKNFVDITHNPLLCDCELYPFYKYVTEKAPRKYQLEMFIDKGNLTCAGPSLLSNQSLIHLTDDVLSCPLTKSCPSSCFCGVRGKDHLTFVNCSLSDLQEVPQSIPDGTSVLYFNKNGLTSMIPLSSDTWSKLKELHLDHNSLTNLDDWKIPSSLRYLSVRGNKLKTLPLPLMQFISNQSEFQLYFGSNDKNCDCNRKTFKQFLLKNMHFIKDNKNILCTIKNNGTFELLPLTSVPYGNLCSLAPKNLNYYPKRLVITLCAFFILLIVVLLVYYRQRQLILSFIYIHCDFLSQLFSSEEYDDGTVFDAFVAYSSSDFEVVSELLEQLENNPPFFNLCIHERNWLPGRFIMDNIASSVENSKRTIIILSSAFISSPWFNIELRAAVFRMSQDKMNKIIVILVEKAVSLDSIDPELRCVVSSRTYLVWGERWFWEKLRYAMPRKKDVKDDPGSNSEFNESLSEVALITEIRQNCSK